MASGGAKWSGLDKFKARLAVIPERQKARMGDTLEASADDLVETMQEHAPKKSGRLAGSIRKEPKGELRVAVKAGGAATTVAARKGHGAYDYALGVEFGHIADPEAATGGGEHVPPKPFFWPTYRAKKKAIKARGAKAFRQAVKEG